MSIHQQATIEATPRQVYAVLADPGALSALSGMGGHPAGAASGHAEGAEFTAFDGHVTGRQVELVPGSRIVQAWRFPDWAPGTYTVVRFTLEAVDNSKTRVRVDQQGYPDGADARGCHPTWHDHLAEGWTMFYLNPLARHFAEQAAAAREVAAAEADSMAQAMAARPQAVAAAGARHA
jgi:uncharacterized protein YndB with AHSA1/START domain